HAQLGHPRRDRCSHSDLPCIESCASKSLDSTYTEFFVKSGRIGSIAVGQLNYLGDASGPAAGRTLMAVGITEGRGIVLGIGIEIQAWRVAKIGVGNSGCLCGPIRR